MKVEARVVYPGGTFARTDLRVAPGHVERDDGDEEPIVVMRFNQAAIVLGLDEACEVATLLLLSAKEMRHEASAQLVDVMIEYGRKIRDARERGAN